MSQVGAAALIRAQAALLSGRALVAGLHAGLMVLHSGDVKRAVSPMSHCVVLDAATILWVDHIAMPELIWVTSMWSR